MKKKTDKEPEDKKTAAKVAKVASLAAELAKASSGRNVVTPASELPFVRRMPLMQPAFDYVSRGGLLVNRINEFVGEYSTLKTYHAMLGIIQFQRYDWANNEPNAFVKFDYKTEHVTTKSGEFAVNTLVKAHLRRGYKPVNTPQVKKVIILDVEGTFDSKRALAMGVDVEGLLYLCPDNLNAGIDVIAAYAADEETSLVVIDALYSVGEEKEAESSMEDNQMSSNPRFWNKAIRVMQAAMNRNDENDITVIAINTTYAKIGISYGDPMKVKNGHQLSLAKSLSVNFTALALQPGKDKNGIECTIGRNIKLKCTKNKAGRPFLDATFYFDFIGNEHTLPGSPDFYQQICDLAVREGLIERSGSWFQYKEFKEQGLEKLVQLLVTNDSIKQLTKDVYATFTD